MRRARRARRDARPRSRRRAPGSPRGRAGCRSRRGSTTRSSASQQLAERARLADVRTRVTGAPVAPSTCSSGPLARSRPLGDHDDVVDALGHLREQVAGDEHGAPAPGLGRAARSRIQRMPGGSRPLVGSSRMSTSGSPSRAAAIAEALAHPHRVALDAAVGCGDEVDLSEHLVDARSRMASGRGEHAQMVAPAPPGMEAGVLEHGADVCARVWPARRSAARRRSPCRACGRIRPSSIRNVVLLPAPFGPRNPVTRPAATVNDRSSTACTEPKRLPRPSISMAFRMVPTVRIARSVHIRRTEGSA